MGANTKIEWCDFTFNPWWGCTKVSDGCKNCYADTLDGRYHAADRHWGPTASRKLMSEAPYDKHGAYDYKNGVIVANDGTVYAQSDLAYDGGPRYREAIKKGHNHANLTYMYRVGKHAAGRLLDGREWNEYPEAPAHG